MSGTEIVVVGGGVIGCAVARALSREGADVLVLDRGVPERRATWASAGMLSPLGEGLEEGPFLDLALASLRAYPAFVRALEAEVGEELGLRFCGKLHVALGRAEEEALRERAEWGRSRGFRMEWLGPGAVGEGIPGLTDRARGGLLIPEDGQVDNRALGRALAEAAKRAGVRLEQGSSVSAVLHRGSRTTGVELEDGTRLSAETVVLAAGAWTGAIEGPPARLPVRPIRGQMVALRPGGGPLPDVMVAGAGVYAVPRKAGHLLVGATVEDAGFDARTTAGGVLRMLEGAVALLPGLAGAELSEVWAGLRPGTPDGLPILGPDPVSAGLYYATGHFRNGILLAPLTGDHLRDLILGRPTPVPPEPFLPGRFEAIRPMA